VARAVRPAVIVIDSHTEDDLDLVPVGRALPDCSLVVLVEPERLSGVYRTLGDQPATFIAKDTEPTQFCQFVRRVATGEQVTDPALSRKQCPLRHLLTARELEALRAIAQGYSNSEIATALFMAPGPWSITHRGSRQSCIRLGIEYRWFSSPRTLA
jgi:DNA-binding NarL/FixJ family response regulator